MSFSEYMQKEVRLIERYKQQYGFSSNEACEMWVKVGLAQRFAQQYRILLSK